MKKIFSTLVKVVYIIAFAFICGIFADYVSVYHYADICGFFFGGIFSATVINS
jgi:hypothetical protein